MRDGVKYWIVYVEGTNDKGEKEQFPITYSGKRIIWEYLIDTVEDNYHLRNIQFNGYNEISEQEYRKMVTL